MSNTHIGYVTYTPEQLKEIQERSKNLRVLDNDWVDQLIYEMNTGAFEPGTRDLMFYEDGRLADGWHVTTAAIRARKPLTIGVKINCTVEEVAKADQGKKRPATVIGKLYNQKTNALPLAVALEVRSIDAKNLKCGISRKLELRNEKHKEACDFVSSNFTGLPLAAQYVVAQEYLRIRNDERAVARLASLGKMLRRNMPKDLKRDSAVLTFYTYLHRTNFADNTQRAKCMERTAACVRAFMKYV